ncbi:hypothetical protein EYC84_010607 [Monilinia fructicola]|uniref:Major facilitator superfamily (MFS) profile domain-containing protein n=1 Tax=Monilinia fructicola TaxID=38448 RepID=A0A5M9JAZ5_MONFR|nr:hypothetical protein EYC84_010607 [Monilinia fructicola]
MFGFSIFQVAVAAGKDLQTILICRFWGGIFGAAPLAVVAAVFSDMFDNKTRGLAITVFSMTVFTAPLLAPFIGLYVALTQPSYNRKLEANNGIPIPEWRLPPVIAVVVSFAIGLFWFGWSGYKADIHWIVPTLSGLLTDHSQEPEFPLFAQYMFKALGINWRGHYLDVLALVLVPIPIGFYAYGAKIRGKSKFAPNFPVQKPARDEEEGGSGSANGDLDVNGRRKKKRSGSRLTWASPCV